MNLIDLAFQAFVYNGAGLNIRRCCVMCVNRDYVRRGEVDPKKFFKVDDITKEVSGLNLQDAMAAGATHLHAHYCNAGQGARCTEEQDLIHRWQPVCNDVFQS